MRWFWLFYVLVLSEAVLVIDGHIVLRLGFSHTIKFH